MKKFCKLMLVALVMFGAAACTKSETSIDKENSEQAGLSFYAEIVNNATRADLEYDADNKVWNTVWEGNEAIVVSLGETSYEFTNNTSEPAKFTCTAEGVASLLGQSVNIAISNPEQSKVGKSGVTVSTDVENFDNTKTIKLEATNSYLRYSYNGEGKVELSLTYEGGKAFVYNEGQSFDAVAFEGVKGENFVSFNAPAEVAQAQLAYSIDGVECKSKSINVVAGKIYNLGELTMPYETSAYSVVGTHNNWTAGKTPMYLVGDYAVAYGVEFTGSSNAFKVLGNDKWLGTNTFALNTWISLTVDTNDMTIAAGKYDIYFSEARTMLCVVEAGATVPELADIEWALAGNFNNWGNTMLAATEVANLFVAKGVELATGTAIKVKDAATWDTSYGGGISNLEPNKWMTLYSNGADIVIAKSGVYDVYFEYGASPKLYLVDADGDYIAATEQTANGTLIPDEIETPEEVVPGEASEWAIIGDFNSSGTWVEKQMVTTATANVFVIEGVEVPKDYFSLLVKKWGDSSWSVKYGGGIVYFNPGNSMKLYQGGTDISITKAGTYDFYFDLTNSYLYVVEPGVDYTTVSEQTVNGEEPKQEEPEVTEKVVYLKPNSNWTQSNARFAAYFWGGAVGEKWVSMTAVGDGTYEAHLPEGYDYGCNIIFCRMNPSTTANNWNNKWNQTSDLKTPTDGKNLYTVKSGTWDKGGGTWSVK
ncbi:MAG: hypothetical protein J6U69_00290 [Alistipes sp.]|nr:hypothetical protein [Alistipes sp.]